MKSNTFRLIILSSLILTEAAAMINGGLASITVPILGLPLFALAAYTTRFFNLKNLILKMLMSFLGLVSIVLGMILIAGIIMQKADNTFGGALRESPYAYVLSTSAAGMYIFGLVGLFRNNYRKRN